MAINTIKATIQMRRGLERDFDADQMTAGEWAVSTDNKYVRMCFAPGVVVRMATYEAFEADMAKIQTILATCENIQDAVDAMASLAEQHKNDAKDYSLQSKSYAVGTNNSVRPNDNQDCSKYYYDQTKRISESITGALKPMGTVTFEKLPALSAVSAGDMYNISNQFTTNTNFKEGSGHVIPAGANIYKTADGKWDVLAGSPVSGVKGDKENTYRQGNVNITPADIGAFPGVKIVTESGTNLNNYTEAGIYYFSSAYAPDNIPTGINGWLIVLDGTTAGSVKQFWLRYGTVGSNDYMTFVRTSNTSTGWSEWKRFAMEDELTPENIGAFPDVKIITAAGEDLDTFKTSGIWFFGANSKPAEYPGNDGRGWLFVMEYSTVVAKQIWLQYGTSSISADMYTRLCKADKSWSPWRRFALSDELDAGMNHFTHLYGGDSASAALNGYYKILSIPLSAVNDSSHAVIKVFAANEYNDSMFPVNLHVIPSKGAERNIFEIYADARSAYFDRLYIKTPAGTGSGEFSLWWKRTKNYTVIAVATLGFYKKTGLNDAERWTYEFPNTPAAEIDEEGYDVTALSADANNLVFRNVPAAIADKLTTARRIDGVTFDGTGNIMHYARCNTAANVAEKTVSCPGFTLVAGAEITVLFDVANTAQNPTLNVNGTGAKTIQYHGKAATAESLSKHRTYRFSYTGATYQIVGLSEDDVFLKTSPEGNWIDRKSKTYWYGSGQNSAEQNGYYKIASIAIAQSVTYTTYGIKLRITSDNFTNYSQVPTEFWVIAGKGNNTSAGGAWVYGDPNSLNSPLLKNNLFIKKEAVAPSNFEIYYYREKEFGEINVEVVTEFKRLGEVSEPFVSTGIWTIHDNAKVDAIEAEGYEVTSLFDKITSASLTIGSEQQPIYMKHGVPTPIGNSLRLKDGITSANVLRIFDDGDEANHGGNLLVCAGGNIFVGSGESASGIYNEYETNGASPDIVGDYYNKAGEQSYFLSDKALFFFANCNTVANRRGFGLTTDGDIIPIAPASGTKRIGTANAHWKDGFFDALHADTAESTTTFTSGDAANPTGWADIATVASGEKHSSLWRKMSLAVKNLRYLWKLMGTTSLAGIGDGTVTGALNALNTGMEYSTHKLSLRRPGTASTFTLYKYGKVVVLIIRDMEWENELPAWDEDTIGILPSACLPSTVYTLTGLLGYGYPVLPAAITLTLDGQIMIQCASALKIISRFSGVYITK